MILTEKELQNQPLLTAFDWHYGHALFNLAGIHFEWQSLFKTLLVVSSVHDEAGTQEIRWVFKNVATVQRMEQILLAVTEQNIKL